MITVKQLTKTFNQFTAVENLSFSIQPGDIVGFLGPNGAGKSTTMKMLTGFITPTSGSIHIDNLDIRQHTKKVQSMIGYLPEGAPAYGDMTVLQFLDFIADVRALRGPLKSERLQKVIEQVGLHEVLDKPIDTLSKGFKRRVGLAQAIIHDPQILILDEPTDGLDPNQKHQVRALIQNLSRDKIVIVSTHILEEVTAVCNRVIIISNGLLKFDDTPAALQACSRYFNAVTVQFSEEINLESLAEIEGVASVEKDRMTGNITLFPVSDTQILQSVTDAIRDNQWPVTQLHVEAGRLDDVFRSITSHDEVEV